MTIVTESILKRRRKKKKEEASKPGKVNVLETSQAAIWLQRGSQWDSLWTDSLVYVSYMFQGVIAEIQKCIAKYFSLLQRSFWTVVHVACCLERTGKTSTSIRNCCAPALSSWFKPCYAMLATASISLEATLESSQTFHSNSQFEKHVHTCLHSKYLNNTFYSRVDSVIWGAALANIHKVYCVSGNTTVLRAK